MDNNKSSLGTKLRIYLLGLAIIIFVFIVISILTYLTNFYNQSIGFSFAYLAGLSMLFLPGTLPLVFFIAPIAMNESPRKGIIMALFFGVGMMITSTVYEAVLIYAGGAMDVLTATVIVVIVGGGWVYVLGLSEIGLIKMNFLKPESALHTAQKHTDYLKVFLIGFSLANGMFWYQNPIFSLLHMPDTAGTFTGWSIAIAYDLGKATSLILITTLGIIVINSTSGIKKAIINPEIDSSTKVTNWGLIFVGAFLLTFGGLFRRWYEDNTVNLAWNNMFITLSDGRIGEIEIFSTNANTMLEIVPQWLGPYVFIILLTIPIILYFYKKQSKIKKAPTGAI
jgi:cytochrome c-type biogenesis protein